MNVDAKAHFSGNSHSDPDEQVAGEELTSVRSVPIGHIARSPYQVRDFTREQHLDELADSITSLGLLQPLLLRPRRGQIPPYELVAGERRLRAAELAGMQEVPAILLALDDQETLRAAIVENAQRENLNPVEEALAYQRLAEDFRLTQRNIAEAVGKKRATISIAVRLLQLAPGVIELLLQERLTAGHGKALLMLETHAAQLNFAKRAIRQGLSVHTLERKISEHLAAADAAEEQEPDKLEQQLARQEKRVAHYLGLEGVQLKMDKQGRKRLRLTFESEAAWKRFVSKLR